MIKKVICEGIDDQKRCHDLIRLFYGLVCGSILIFIFFLSGYFIWFSWPIDWLWQFPIYTYMVYKLWERNIPLDVYLKSGFGDVMELCSIVVLMAWATGGPAMALLSNTLGISIFYYRIWSRKESNGRAALSSPPMNTLPYGISFLVMFLLLRVFHLFPLKTYSFGLFLTLTSILLIQTFVVVIISVYYLSLVNNIEFSKQLWERIQPRNIFVEAFQVLLFPGLALLALRMLHFGYGIALLLIALLFEVIYRSFMAFKRVQDNLYDLILAMMEIVEKRDPYTEWHCGNVAEYSVLIGRYRGFGGDRLLPLRRKARIHDFGKILVPDDILLAKRQYDRDAPERRIIEKHTHLKDIIIDLLPPEFEITQWLAEAIHHHERWDGNGYPDKLKGTDIPEDARIMAVADSWDAMTTGRIYRPTPKTPEQAIEELKKYRGTQWEPESVDAFLLAYESGDVMKLKEQREAERRKEKEEEALDDTTLSSVFEASIHERNRSGNQIKGLKIEVAGDKPVRGSNFSYLKTVVDGIKIFWPFLLGMLFYFLLQVHLFPEVLRNSRDFIFFTGLLLTTERWELKLPLSFNMIYGEIIYLLSLFIFPLPIIVSLIVIGTLWRILAKRQSLGFEIVNFCKRVIIYSLFGAAFEWLGLRGNESVFGWTQLHNYFAIKSLLPALQTFLLFLLWMAVNAVFHFLFVSYIARIRVSKLPVLNQRVKDYLYFYAFVFPVFSYIGYFFYAVKPMLFPFSYLIFLPIVFVTFLLFKIYGDHLNAARLTSAIISKAVDEKFPAYTRSNTESIAELARMVAIAMRFNEEEVEWVSSAAHVYNIGRVGIRDDILLGTNLSPENLKKVTKLCDLSVKILKKLPFFKDLLPIVDNTHERLDGKGYPKALKGKQIPLGSCIISAVEALVAMVSFRPDRHPLTLKEAFSELEAKSGTQFDPEIVQTIIKLYKQGVLRVTSIEPEHH